MRTLLIILITSCSLSLFSCKLLQGGVKQIQTHDDMRVEFIRTLTPVIFPVETASARAMLECNHEGMILMSRLSIETTRNAKLSLMIDSLNTLSVDAVIERDTFYLPSDSVIIIKDVLRTEIEYRDKDLTRWQQIKQEAGGIAIGGCVGLIVILIVSLFFKLKR